jgi:hypothetical protein
MGLGRIPDQYTVRARLLPALLVALPAGVATLAWFPDGILGWGAVWGLITWSGGTLLLAQIGRDAGKRKEARLFELWGGKPTTRMLRHAGGANPVTLARRHEKLKSLMQDVKLPTPEEEAADPHAADEVYEACTTFLREKTRDRKKFDLVFEENCNYGFRRNLWGMKPLGLVIALLALAAIVGIPVTDPAARSGGRLGLVAVTGAVGLLLLLGWLFVFTPGWVRVAAGAYAERLLEASERL